MNKNRIKQVKALCSRLPVSYEQVYIGYKVKPHEVLRKIDDGLELPEGMTINDIDLNPDVRYRLTRSHIIQINHYKRIKKAYNRGKEKSVIEYLKWLKLNNLKMNKLFKELGEQDKISQWSSLLDDMIDSGVKGFWKTLAAFITSFLAIFGTSKDK